VLRGAGGRVTDCRGAALRYNQRDPRQRDGIVACGPGVQEWVLETIGPLYAAANQAGAGTPGA
jgi:3'-phosphoadenosine 5'-phosphosulfate (PAPS) 3'-phosphatase